MKEMKLIIATVALLGFISAPAAYADGFAPGEGLYVGIFGGGGMGIVQPKVSTNGDSTAPNAQERAVVDGERVGQQIVGGRKHAGGTFETTDGGLGMAGFEGGGWLGYGYKMGDLYAGIEGEMAAGDVTFKVTSSVNVALSGSEEQGDEIYITSVETTKNWTGGMFGRLGYYLNKDTLLSARGGVLISEFTVEVKGSTDYSEDFYGGGPAIGTSLTSRLAAIDPNLSLRVGAVYTDFLTASVFGIGTNSKPLGTHGHNSEVTGSALAARAGLTYSFFDVSSLF